MKQRKFGLTAIGAVILGALSLMLTACPPPNRGGGGGEHPRQLPKKKKRGLN
jgi:hypothetical protein